MTPRRLLALAALVFAFALALPAQAGATVNVFRTVAGNPADKLDDLQIDDFQYDYAKSCRRNPTPGILALQSWLGKNAGGSFWGNMRCEKLSKKNYSLHSEGRALDWHLDVHNARDRREADRILSLLLAPDKLGNPHALARRMGIQELIWNCTSWWSGSETMGRYSLCYDSKGKRRKIDDTSAHRNHIHFGLNWAGARKQSSFWARGR
jgi:hypothetical protein